MKVGCLFGSSWDVSDFTLVYPVDRRAVVTQTFAEHVAAARRNGWKNYNGGIDWGVDVGTPIVAAADGIARPDDYGSTSYGKCVRIDHGNGCVTIYGHMSMTYVAAGQKVRAGELIGLSGNTGNSTGPHLHFELRKGGKAIDPADYLADEVIPPVVPPVFVEPGQVVYIQPNYNLRAGPGTNEVDLGTVDATMQAEVIEQRGDWLKVRSVFWVHRDGVQG